jgi:hypothetical protein
MTSARPTLNRRGTIILMAMILPAFGVARSGYAADSARVYLESGNIVIEKGGQRRQLSKLGRDSDPVLSPDGTWVAFTRGQSSSREGDDGECKSGAQADELRRIQSDGTGERVLLRGRRGATPEQNLCGFSSKQFSSDGRSLYFLSPAWATSSALHVLNTRDSSQRFLLAANDLIVLNSCTNKDYRDKLIVQQHRYFAFGGSFDWYWLYESDGKREVGPIGDYDDAQAVTKAIDDSGLCTQT